MGFATFNIKGYKKGLIGIGKHLDRSGKEAKKTGLFEDEVEKNILTEIGFHIDPCKTHLNEEWVDTGKRSLAECAENRIQEGYKGHKAIRSDAVKALGLIMTGSHDRMKEIEANEPLFERWKRANWDFVCREFGEKNIVRFTIHRDERTPHIHCVVVPITPDGRLSAKHYRDGIIKLQGYQNRYAQAMEPFGLERGIESKLTGRKHETIQEYYKRINGIEREIERETKHINTCNPFQRGKAKEELERLQTEIGSLKIENRQLKQEVAYTKNTQQTIIGNQIKTDLEMVKHQVNLIQHVASMGYVLDREKSSKTWAVMEKEGDKILIKNGLNQSGHWVYKSLSDDHEKGTIVDFMLKRGFSYQSIRGLMSNHLDSAILEEQKKLSPELKDRQVKQYIAQSFFEKIVEHNKENYLQSRGIQEATYAPYQGDGLKVGNKAVFTLFEGVDRQGNGTICSTITYQFKVDGSGKSDKYFQKGLSRGLNVLKDPNSAVDKIIITESPIDALSYKQMHQELNSTMYLSTCGNLSEGIKNELKNLFSTVRDNGPLIVLAFDNDTTGQQMQKEIMNLANDQQIKVQGAIPAQEKDWNQALQNQLDFQQKQNLRRFQKELASSGQEYELRKRNKREPNVLGMEIVIDGY